MIHLTENRHPDLCSCTNTISVNRE